MITNGFILQEFLKALIGFIDVAGLYFALTQLTHRNISQNHKFQAVGLGMSHRLISFCSFFFNIYVSIWYILKWYSPSRVSPWCLLSVTLLLWSSSGSCWHFSCDRLGICWLCAASVGSTLGWCQRIRIYLGLHSSGPWG